MKLARLRLARRQPCSLPLDSPFPLTLKVTTDLGDAIYLSSGLQIIVELLDPSLSKVSSSFTVVNSATNTSTIDLSFDRGDFHAFTLVVKSISKLPLSKSGVELQLRLRAVPTSTSLSPKNKQLATFLTEDDPCVVAEEGENYLILSVTSAFKLLPRSASASSEKAQKTIATSKTPKTKLQIYEQPDLSLGAHLWDCALILSFRLLAQCHTQKVVIDLGAGCGLVGGLLASQMKSGVVWSTDTEAVVESSVDVNLPLLKQSASVELKSKVLDWEEDFDCSVFGKREEECLIVASDVLYNIGSHEIFLKTLLRLLQYFTTSTALIAYKPRMDGDDAFFAMATELGLKVEEWVDARWDVVQIWCISKQ